MKPIIIDCDPGHDDAVAILLALASPEVELIGVTTVAGNSGLDNTTRNALTVLEVAGRSDIPVARGSDAPLRRPLRIADAVHGASGLDGPDVPPPTATPIEAHAVEFLANTLKEASAPITLIPVGPLTNIARLITDHPDALSNVERVVLMGGALTLGNRSPAAEFNIWVDPEAADIVFRSGLDLTMVGLDLTHQVIVGNRHGDRMRPLGRCGAFVADLLGHFTKFYGDMYGYDGAAMHDAVAVAEVIWPDLIESKDYYVEVDVTDGPSAGRTLVDKWAVMGEPSNCRVGLAVDGDDLIERLIDRIGTLR